MLTLSDPTAVGEARRETSALVTRLNFSEADVGRVALIVTELATNAVLHAGGGEVHCRAVEAGSAAGVELLVIDRGPGMTNLTQSMTDGTSTGGTLGLGLGVLRRTADEWDIHTSSGQGTVVLARVWAAPPPRGASRFISSGLCVPYPGEPVSGDEWAATECAGRLQVAVADGLGHGALASDAARPAVDCFRRRGNAPLDGSGLSLVLEEAHRALRAHRGAAMTVVSIDPARGIAHVAGVGNIGGLIVDRDGTSRGLVAHNGTLGATMRKVQPFSYPWPKGGTLVLFSDGLQSSARLDRYPGLLSRDPAVIAGVLYRDFKRGTDDVTVFVARERG